ncbi:hypothetical protein BKA69DRAFT_587680 [Paraphysoderma sedebokerense]|nr:hypothetical protein BKA69DRAFT_587680 [Paraphysoderma sedebokerense]
MPCKTEDAKSGCAKKPALLSNQLKLDNRDQPVNEDDDKKIFLRNINHFMTDDALVSAFSYWGTVKSIKSFRAKPFGGFAILTFENKEAAQNCLNRSMYVAPRFAISAMEYKPRSQRHRIPKVNRSIMRDDDFPTLRRT